MDFSNNAGREVSYDYKDCLLWRIPIDTQFDNIRLIIIVLLLNISLDSVYSACSLFLMLNISFHLDERSLV